MYAVVIDRNKSYLVEDNLCLTVDKLDLNNGDIFEFSDITLFFDGKDVIMGNPFVKGVKVISEVIKTYRDNKINGVKFKRRKHYLKRYGHKQYYTVLKIISINIV